nr:MAG TPA: hypothetical protein [Caudoviricetes sp.]DAV19243.1 MAG TPA: hypothetical protein [Bacteriophage sp.]
MPRHWRQPLPGLHQIHLVNRLHLLQSYGSRYSPKLKRPYGKTLAVSANHHV